MFVTFEGPEGAGKSSVIAALSDRLIDQGRSVFATREPGSGPVGSQIRRLLLEGGSLDPLCELFLFLADRAQHVATEIRPALARGDIVLCDRYADSTEVYQGVARGLAPQTTQPLNALATGALRPNLTFLLDVAAEVGLARVTDANRLDREPLEFHRQVRQGFLDLAAQDPDRWRIIDASQPLHQVVEACWDAIQAALRD